uniref:Uncharacterized protein n=1 Tax=Anguilla anguilla TaxID=7936 RepID=A0A0E9PX10_ANGAN
MPICGESKPALLQRDLSTEGFGTLSRGSGDRVRAGEERDGATEAQYSTASWASPHSPIE